jgi:hypothetical protein
MAEETKTETKQETKQETKSEPKDDKSAAELAATRAELEKYRAAEAKRSEDAKKADDDKRVKDGEAQKLLAERQKDLEAANERAKKLEDSARARVEKQISVLPDEAKKRIALVKDALPLDKLSELVDSEIETAGKAAKKLPPNGSPKGGDREKEGAIKLDDDHNKALRHMGKNPKGVAAALDMAEVVEKNGDGVVFRMSIDEVMERHKNYADGSPRCNPRPLSYDQYLKDHK